MAQVRYIEKVAVQTSTPLTDHWEPLFLHAAYPNPVDRDRKDASNPEKQNTREHFLLGLAFFRFSALVRVIRGTLSGTCTRPCVKKIKVFASACPIQATFAVAVLFPLPAASLSTIRLWWGPVFVPLYSLPFDVSHLPTTLSAYCSILPLRTEGIGCTSIIISLVEWR